jgi:hypothetical protein
MKQWFLCDWRTPEGYEFSSLEHAEEHPSMLPVPYELLKCEIFTIKGEAYVHVNPGIQDELIEHRLKDQARCHYAPDRPKGGTFGDRICTATDAT